MIGSFPAGNSYSLKNIIFGRINSLFCSQCSKSLSWPLTQILKIQYGEHHAVTEKTICDLSMPCAMFDEMRYMLKNI